MAVKLNNAWFDSLGRMPGVVSLTMRVTSEIARTAIANAPVDTGAYRRGISVRQKYQQRIVGMVVARDPNSMIIESRTGNLARALRANAKRGRRG